MEPAGFSLREPERTSPTDVSSGSDTPHVRPPLEEETPLAYARTTLLRRAEATLHGSARSTLTVVASTCGVSSATLSRTIRAAHCESFRQWKARLVFARLEAMLQKPAAPQSLKEVAVAMGFRTPTSFARWLRRQTGLTPSDFRASCAGLERRSPGRPPGSRVPLQHHRIAHPSNSQ